MQYWNDKFLVLLDLVTIVRRKRKKKKRTRRIMETSVFTVSVRRKIIKCVDICHSSYLIQSFAFLLWLPFFIFLFYCKLLTSVLQYLFYLQRSKTTPEGRQAPAQEAQCFHISHSNSRNSWKLWLQEPAACWVDVSLTFCRDSATGTAENRHREQTWLPSSL